MTSPPALSYDTCYHIYNRGVNRENIFLAGRDYARFLVLLEVHLLPVADVYAYNLLRNHFHLAVRVKSGLEISALRGAQSGRALVPSVQFSNFFNAYAKYFNARYGRTGSLFQHPFGRKPVMGEEYFQNLIVYIHRNPQLHGLIDDFREWKYSSYGVLTSSAPTKLAREEIFRIFQSRRLWLTAHKKSDSRAEAERLSREDFDEGDFA